MGRATGIVTLNTAYMLIVCSNLGIISSQGLPGAAVAPPFIRGNLYHQVELVCRAPDLGADFRWETQTGAELPEGAGIDGRLVLYIDDISMDGGYTCTPYNAVGEGLGATIQLVVIDPDGPTPPSYDLVHFDVQVSVEIKRVFTEELLDPKSVEYQELSIEITYDLTALFANNTFFLKISIKEFTESDSYDTVIHYIVYYDLELVYTSPDPVVTVDDIFSSINHTLYTMLDPGITLAGYEIHTNSINDEINRIPREEKVRITHIMEYPCEHEFCPSPCHICAPWNGRPRCETKCNYRDDYKVCEAQEEGQCVCAPGFSRTAGLCHRREMLGWVIGITISGLINLFFIIFMTITGIYYHLYYDQSGSSDVSTSSYTMDLDKKVEMLLAHNDDDDPSNIKSKLQFSDAMPYFYHSDGKTYRISSSEPSIPTTASRCPLSPKEQVNDLVTDPQDIEEDLDTAEQLNKGYVQLDKFDSVTTATELCTVDVNLETKSHHKDIYKT